MTAYSLNPTLAVIANEGLQALVRNQLDLTADLLSIKRLTKDIRQ